MGRVGIILLCLAQGAVAESHVVTQVIAASSVGIVNGRRATAKDIPEALHLKIFNEENGKSVLKFKCSSVAVGMCVLSAAHCLSPREFNVASVSARTPEGYEGTVEMLTVRTPEAWKGKNPENLPPFYNDIAIARLSSRPVQTLSREDIGSTPIASLIDKPLEVGAYGAMYDEKEKSEMTSDLALTEQSGAIVGNWFLKHRELTIPHRIVGNVKGFQGLVEQPEHAPYSLLVMTPNPSAVRPGDSGAPIFLTENGKRKLVGIVEGMKNQNPEMHTESTAKLPDDGSIAVLLSTHYPWLMKQIDDLKCFETKSAPQSMGEIR